MRQFRSKYIGDRAFYKRVILIALPMIAQHAISSFVSLLDNIMIGRVGTEQMSGVAIINTLMFVYNICVFGGTSGAGIFGTQYYGKGDYEGQKYAFRFKIYITIAIAVIAMLLFGFFGTELIQLYLSDSGDVGNVQLALEFGHQYLSIMMIGLLPFALTNAYVSSIRESGHTFVPMLAGVIAMFTNLFLNWLLIFGVGPFPQWGVAGAAIATVISRYVELLIVAIWAHRHTDINRYLVGAYKSPYIPGNVLKGIILKGTPLMLNELFWAAGMATITQCYAVRGLEVVAALNISSTISNLFNVVYIQLGGCIAIVVGQFLGAGKLDEARDAQRKVTVFSVFCCAMMSIIMIIIGRFFPNLYATEESIKELAVIFIIISAAVMPICAYCHCSYFTLRSGGKTISTFIFDSGFTWVLAIPIASFLAKGTGLSIILVFLLVQALELIKAVIGFFMVRKGSWLVNIVKEN